MRACGKRRYPPLVFLSDTCIAATAQQRIKPPRSNKTALAAAAPLPRLPHADCDCGLARCRGEQRVVPPPGLEPLGSSGLEKKSPVEWSTPITNAGYQRPTKSARLLLWSNERARRKCAHDGAVAPPRQVLHTDDGRG